VRRPHIVLISQIPLWSMGRAVGGPAFQNTIIELARCYRVSLVTPELGYVDPADLPDGVTLHPFKHHLHGLWRSVPKLGWLTDTLGWYTFRASAARTVRRLCATGDVDLLYGYEIYGVPVARAAADRFGLPMVARYQGTLMYRRRDERLATLRFWKHVAALRTPADLVIMTDDGTLGDEVLRDLGHPAERIRFWMNGIDRSIREHPAPGTRIRNELGVPEDGILLLTVSRLSHWKRVDRAIAVTRILAEEGRPVTLAIAGTGPEEQRLHTLAADAGIAERVHFLGGVPRDRLSGLYRSADALLSFYDYSNLANPVLEAMLLGTPVIALDVGGTRGLITHGVNGILAPSSDATDLARITSELMSSSTRRTELGRSAALWADKHLWSWVDRMAAERFELELLMGASSAPSSALSSPGGKGRGIQPHERSLSKRIGGSLGVSLTP
jgi:glycosyltransferase involved in cell wall biosynthesis